MAVFESIKNGLVESLKAKYIFPFAFLNFMLFSTMILFVIPIMYVLNQVYVSGISPIYISIIAVNALSMFIVFIIYYLLKVWFIGGIIRAYHKRKDFFDAINDVKKEYLSILSISLLFIFIAAIIQLFVKGKILSSLLIMLLDILLIFSFQSVVIKRDNAKLAIARSIAIVKKIPLSVFMFWITTRTIVLTIFLFTLILFSPIVYILGKVNPFASEIGIYNISKDNNSFLVDSISYISINYPAIITLGFIVTLIASYVEVFLKIATTDFFLKVSRKRRFL